MVSNGIDAGLVTNHVFQNTNIAHRVYDASRARWSVNGQFTLELRNDRRLRVKGSTRRARQHGIGDYPEIFPAAQFYPTAAWRISSAERLAAGCANLQLSRRRECVVRQACGATTTGQV